MRGKIGLLAPAEHLYDQLDGIGKLALLHGALQQVASAGALQAALEEVGLAERAQEFAGNLSAGMKCRLSIAKWRLLDPGLTAARRTLRRSRRQRGRFVRRLICVQHCARGHIVIMASHHVARALNLCGRALILHQGRLHFDEPKQTPWPAFDHAFGDFLPRGGL